jgi:membrane associated rhomboid family serine protease
MFESIWNDVKREFNHGNMVTRIIIINVAIFVAVNIFKLVLFVSNGGQLPGIYDTVVHFFCMSSDWKFLLTHPWGIITSMFLHEGFWHILWNMLFMYWFGTHSRRFYWQSAHIAYLFAWRYCRSDLIFCFR